MIREQCTELCGYAAAVAAAFCFGSFGVPVKSKVASRLDIDPMVMQTYKSLMCFICCWAIILLDEPLKFTPWGLISGLFWVPGGVAGIYAIRNAGIAMAVGTWSSIIVLTSFFWGIVVFEERVKSITGAVGAVLTLIMGLVGMALFSVPGKDVTGVDKGESKKLIQKDVEVGVEGDVRKPQLKVKKLKYEAPTPEKREDDADMVDEEGMRKRQKLTPKDSKQKGMKRKRSKLAIDGNSDLSPRGKPIASAPKSTPLTALEIEKLIQPKIGEPLKGENKSLPLDKKNTITFFDGSITLTRRQAGLIAAVFNGLWGGTNLVPLHFAAQAGYGGPSYMISFACGSMIITICLWILRYTYELYRLDGELSAAYHALPSFHIQQMWFQGMLSGLLYSLGNFMSIISVTYLGQGVGYSFTQFSMLVSGLWGILKFGEIKGQDRIMNWFFSAVTAVMGILWLCYEHSSF